MRLLRFFCCLGFSCCWIFSCSTSDIETGVKNEPPVFAADSTFQIRGISLEAPAEPIDTVAMQEIAATNANWVALVPYAFCRKEDPIVHFGTGHQWWGETAEGIAGCVSLARQNKLKVMLKPHLWIGGGMYTGHFEMPDAAAWLKWEESYLSYIIHFASLADSLQVELFCIGTELGKVVIERPSFWSALIDSVRKLYHGKLTYAANWDDYAQFPYWQRLDFVGIDGYFPLSNDRTPSTREITQGWKKYIDKLERFSSSINRPVLFTEYGYRNADHCAETPWTETSDAMNNEAQANAYAGFYNSFSNKAWFRGGFAWKWHAGNFHNERKNVDFTPQQKPALEIIRSFYGAAR